MGEQSSYYKELNQNQKRRVREIKKKLPVYTHPFVERCLLDYQVNTALSYARDLLTFFEFLQEKNPICTGKNTSEIPENVIQSISAADIDEYQAFLTFNDSEHAHANNVRGLARRMSSLRSFFKYQVDHDHLETDPTLKAAKGRRDKGKDIIRLDSDEVGRLLDSVENTRLSQERAQKISENTRLRDTAIITLLLNLGIRVSECVGLDVDDVNFDDNTITIVRKGGKEARLFFGEDIRNTLRDYINHERPLLLPKGESGANEKALFLSLKRKRMSVRSVEYMVKKFSSESVAGKKISPHKLRSTYGTALYNQTSDIRLVADVLGHKDVNTTIKHYAAIDEEHRRRAAEVKPYG